MYYTKRGRGIVAERICLRQPATPDRSVASNAAVRGSTIVGSVNLARRLIGKTCLFFSVGVISWTLTSTAHANQLAAQLAKVAATIKQIAESQRVDSVAIGRFTGPPTFPTSAGTGLTVMFKDELERVGLTVKRRASIGIKGEYFIESDAVGESHDQPLAIRIEIELVDQFGKVLTNLDFQGDLGDDHSSDAIAFAKGKAHTQITDTDDMLAMIGPNVDLPPDTNLKKRDEILRQSLQKPNTLIRGNQVLAGPNSPYAIEVLTRKGTDFQPIAPTNDDGLAFVGLAKGDIYAIRVTNRSPLDAAVRITIDGLNMFAFADNRDFKFMIIPAGKSTLIKGWYRTSSTADSFKVGTLAESAIKELGENFDEVGTITVAFSAAWPENSPPPEDEASAKLLATRGEKLATGRGPSTESLTQLVTRHIGVPRAVISVRYSQE